MAESGCGGLPATSKPDKAYHGYGLKSIRYVAEKYGGVFSYKAEGGIFRASVLFPVPGCAAVFARFLEGADGRKSLQGLTFARAVV